MASQKYGKWIIERSLSEGGQAHTFIVYAEDDPEMTPHVLKRLKNLKRIERFISEIEIVRKFSHPYIVKIVDFDADASKPYLVMPYYSRGTLSNINLSDMPLLDKLLIFRKIIRGIRYAHNQTNSVIHRDIKPENIFINDNGDPVIGDFGICHIINGERFTLIDEPVGAFHYMAPELEDGRNDDIDKSADVYSLGKLLYWIITGKTFAREKHREQQYDMACGNELPDNHLINQLLDKMIVADPMRRLQNGNQVLEQLDLIIKVIKRQGHAIGPDIPQLCTYCGRGIYRRYTDGNYNFGIHPTGNAKLIIVVCDYCSNVQLFRPDQLVKDPWGEVKRR